MRTTLTPEFYQLFAVLLVAAMAVTFVVAAVADGAFVWLLRRLSARRLPRRATVLNVPERGRTAPAADRTPVRR
ncbi:hypothetical protein OOK29_16710 [Streptomyces phaeochromogenes]|uniref:hypothetical protein n=1 Tax=Streptomyces phaeochromogenes TaxID=1923 RepID=UPI00224D0642|nr:hypothetical protein [Streptomyces phaeochromogenes]MCX5599783.1 hypothetical protein [Streptomyces phaeochromogenes]